MYPKGCAKAFEALMQETPYSHYDSGCDGICPECGHVSSIVRIGNISLVSLSFVPILQRQYQLGGM